MDREEIRYLLGSTIYARAKAYESRVAGVWNVRRRRTECAI